MRKSKFLGIAFLLSVPCISASMADTGLGFTKPNADKTLRTDFRTPPPGYGEEPFW